MNIESRVIVGICLCVIGLTLITLSLILSLFILIYGIPVIVIGLFILFNKKEDEIELRKDLNKRVYKKH